MGVLGGLILKPTSIYSQLTQITYIFDDVGLVNNTDNLYGTVSVGGNVEKWKSIAPGLVGADYTFTQNVGSDPYPTLNNGVKFQSGQILVASSLDQWLFLIKSVTPNALKWSLSYVFKFDPNPNSFILPFINIDGATSVANGFWTYIDDRSGRDNGIALNMRNSDGTAINFGLIPSFWIPNIEQVITLTYDHSLASENFKAYNGNTLVGTRNKTGDNTGSELGRIMQLSSLALPSPSAYNWRTIVAQEVVETDAVRNNFINRLKSKYGIS